MHSDCVAAARFVRLRFVSDPYSLSGKVLFANERPKLVRSEHVKFAAVENVRSEYTKFDDLSVRVARSISPEEELLVDHCKTYEFK